MFTGRGKQLTIFVTETDHYHHQALYMAIIEILRRSGCRLVLSFSSRDVASTPVIFSLTSGGS